jgi:hypothetical protein
VKEGRSCVDVAAMYENVKVRTLQRRYKRWEEEKSKGDQAASDIIEGKIDGRRYSHSALKLAEEQVIADQIKKEKSEHKIVLRRKIREAAMEQWRSVHKATRKNTFKCSPQFITRFRRCHNIDTSEHQLRKDDSKDEDKEKELLGDAVEFLVHKEEAVKQFGANMVLNLDETAAQAVQHPSRSWHIKGDPNIVNTNKSENLAITTTPCVTAAGDKLALQVIAKGTTTRTVKTRISQLMCMVTARCRERMADVSNSHSLHQRCYRSIHT